MIDRETIVEEVIRRWPQTIPVFLGYRMACVGCSMAPFETVREAAASYKLPEQGFVDALNGAIAREDG